MRRIWQVVSWLSLVVLVLPSVLYLAGSDAMGLDRVKAIMVVATVVWFVTASLWMWKEDGRASEPAGEMVP